MRGIASDRCILFAVDGGRFGTFFPVIARCTGRLACEQCDGVVRFNAVQKRDVLVGFSRTRLPMDDTPAFIDDDIGRPASHAIVIRQSPILIDIDFYRDVPGVDGTDYFRAIEHIAVPQIL